LLTTQDISENKDKTFNKNLSVFFEALFNGEFVQESKRAPVPQEKSNKLTN